MTTRNSTIRHAFPNDVVSMIVCWRSLAGGGVQLPRIPFSSAGSHLHHDRRAGWLAQSRRAKRRLPPLPSSSACLTVLLIALISALLRCVVGVCVFCVQAGRGRTATFLACFLSWQGRYATPQLALRHILSALHAPPAAASRIIGPTQRRFVSSCSLALSFRSFVRSFILCVLYVSVDHITDIWAISETYCRADCPVCVPSVCRK